jgi:hypothetical protein
MEDKETLEASALVRKLSDAVQNQIHNFFANGVVTSGIIVGGILLPSDKLLRVEQLPVCASTNLICGHINTPSSYDLEIRTAVILYLLYQSQFDVLADGTQTLRKDQSTVL